MVTIRLSRVGRKKIPAYRIVVADQRTKRDGRIIEWVGNYDPREMKNFGTIKKDRVDYWLAKGATPTRTVSQMLKRMAKST
jgi:small subunit ribosomal protein S16